MNVDLGLAGKVAIVTGAAGGIGKAVAAAFAAAGARVAVVDLDRDRCGAVAGALPGGPHLGLPLDISDIDAHAGVVERARTELGGLDNLTCLAAVLVRRADVFEVTEQDWDRQHAVNLKGTFFLNLAFARAVLDAGGTASIVNFTSQGWWTGGYGGSVAYAASKGGIVSMSRGLARALAPSVTVNTVAPGAVDTPMMRDGLSDDELATFVATIPMGRMAKPSELVGSVLFLASDLARYVTGATLNVTGGQLMY